jgi:hypothetical protein
MIQKAPMASFRHFAETNPPIVSISLRLEMNGFESLAMPILFWRMLEEWRRLEGQS